jgi:tetratricopeptide (TPR) repeat protein
MRALAALTLYVSFSLALPGQETQGAQETNRIQEQTRAVRNYLNSGDYVNAERCLRQAISEAGDDADNNNNAPVRVARIALADLLHEQGREPEARRLYETVLHSAAVSPGQKYDAMAGIADIDGMSGTIPETSAREWTDALALAREQQSAQREADALRGLGLTWLEAGNPSRAEPLLRRSLGIFENDAATPPVALAATLTCIAQCYRLEDKLALAEDALTRALALNRQSFGETHPQVAFIMERLAEIYAQRHSFDQARAYSDRAIAAMRICCGVNSPAVAAALVNRGSIERHANALEAAAENYAEALRIVQSTPGDSVLELHIIERYTPILKAIHREREARELTSLAKTFRLTPDAGASRPQGTR